MNEDLLDILRWNVREPIQVEGDLYSLAACNETGSRRLIEMMEEFELDSLDRLAEHIVESSRRGMLEEIRQLKPGMYRNTMRIDAVSMGGRWLERAELDRMIALASDRLDGAPPPEPAAAP